MKTIEFIPRYGFFQTYFVLLCQLVLAGILFFGFFQTYDIKVFVLLGAYLYLPLSKLLPLPKAIIFSSDRVIVRRLFLSDLRLFYNEITFLDGHWIGFGKMHLSISEMSNSKELRSLFSNLIKDGKVEKINVSHQSPGQVLMAESLFASLPSLIVCALIVFVLYSYANLQIDFKEFLYIEIVGYVSTCISIYLIRKYFLNKKS